MAEAEIERLPQSRKEALRLGERHYFTGKPCVRGHMTMRLTSTRGCVECQKGFGSSYRAKNIEKERARCRAWSKNNLGKERERHKKMRKANPEKWREIGRVASRRRREASPEKLREYGRTWRDNNPDRVKENLLRWHRENPEKSKTLSVNRRARRKKAEGAHTHDDIARIRKAQNDRCGYCRAPLKGRGHADHIIALSKGGSNWPSNIQLLCESCNCSKKDKDPIEFARSRGKLL